MKGVDGGDTCPHFERGTEVELLDADMHAVQADTEPHHVGVDFFRVEGSGCRGKVEEPYVRHLCADMRDRFVPHVYLCRRMRGVRRVRIGKVRIYTFKHYVLIRANKRISIFYLAW